MKKISVYVSKTDELASFGGIFFQDDEADKMVEFAEKLGYTVEKEETDDRFADVNSPFRKNSVRDIDWSDYNNILYVINNRDKTNQEITIGLRSAGSGMSVAMKKGIILSEYATILENTNGELTEALKIEFAKTMAGKFISNKQILMNEVSFLRQNGCTVGSASGYPECEGGFNDVCPSCPHNHDAGKPIRSDADIAKYNEILNGDK